MQEQGDDLMDGEMGFNDEHRTIKADIVTLPLYEQLLVAQLSQSHNLLRSYASQHYVSTMYSYQRNKMMISQDATKFTPPSPFFLKRSLQGKRRRWGIKFALDTGGFPTNGSQDNDINEDSPGLGQTRLSRILIAAGRQLLGKLNSARKSFPMKVFLLLLGFYTANALATILGQTGDWDVLVAGIVVAAIEGIGMLTYKRTTSRSPRMQSLIVLINYWKAGVCLGLFVDAFKVGS